MLIPPPITSDVLLCYFPQCIICKLKWLCDFHALHVDDFNFVLARILPIFLNLWEKWWLLWLIHNFSQCIYLWCTFIIAYLCLCQNINVHWYFLISWKELQQKESELLSSMVNDLSEDEVENLYKRNQELFSAQQQQRVCVHFFA